MVRIDISNRALLVYGSLFVLFLSIGFGIAFNSGGPPSLMGHSAGELEGVCLTNGTNCLSETRDFTTQLFQLSCFTGNYPSGSSTTFNDVCETQFTGSICVDVNVQQWCGAGWCAADCYSEVWGPCRYTIDSRTFRVTCGKLV